MQEEMNISFSVESLKIGESVIDNLNFDFSTGDENVANKMFYLFEIITGVMMKGVNHD